MSPAAAPLHTRAEVVVVGSGAGGAPVAATLAEAGLDVLLLEAGPHLEAADFSADEAEARFRLGRPAATADGTANLYAGSCVGGSTVINDALCWRPPPEVLESWRTDHGLLELDEAAFAPHVERAWRDVHAEPTGPGHINRNARRLEQGGRRLGWATEAMPRNVRGCARLGRCNFGCPIDAKQSMLVTYVPRALRAGARLLANARVERIRVEAGAVSGVDVTRLDPRSRLPTGTLRVDASRICLAGGVLGTPALLQRSGLAEGRAGRGIQLHSSVYVTARFDEPILGWYGPTMAVAISEFSDVGGHAGPGYMLENTSVQPMQTAAVLPGFGDAHARAMKQLPFLGHTVVVLRDRARGELRATGTSGLSIDYRLVPADLERIRGALANSARAYLAADAREVWLPVNGLPPVRSEADLTALETVPLDPSRLTLLYAVHLFGGAAMGRSAANSVCAEDGSCWDARGLYVTDAASLPTNTGVNPQITIMANALRIASGIVS